MERSRLLQAMSGKGRLLPLVMMKLSCSLHWWMWFLLLFGAGSMLLLLHLPEFFILVHPQNPGLYPMHYNPCSPCIIVHVVHMHCGLCSPCIIVLMVLISGSSSDCRRMCRSHTVHVSGSGRAFFYFIPLKKSTSLW